MAAALKGWASIAAVVVAYDTWAAATHSPTLSAQFMAAAEEHPVVIGAVNAYLVTHLWGRWPRKLDPFCGFCWAVGRLVG